MTHRFPIKEIAAQSGLSTATVDRVLNDRPNVSTQTKARVAAAVAELEGQEAQLVARGRRMFFDFVLDAPHRFTREVQIAAEHVVGHARPAACRLRFSAQEAMQENDIIAILNRIAKRGSQGVCLKAQDTPRIRAAVDALAMAGIPVVTLVTDIKDTHRIAYVGLDNQIAGRTAAYLVAKSVPKAKGAVLSMRSHDQFFGEAERQSSFQTTLAALCPDMRFVNVSGGKGAHYDTGKVIDAVAGELGDLCAVYSMGGGNAAILGTLRSYDLHPQVYIGHDLDRENRELLGDSKIDFVLHHDLKQDIQNVLQAFLHFHRLVPDLPYQPMSHVQIITPYNMIAFGPAPATSLGGKQSIDRQTM